MLHLGIWVYIYHVFIIRNLWWIERGKKKNQLIQFHVGYTLEVQSFNCYIKKKKLEHTQRHSRKVCKLSETVLTETVLNFSYFISFVTYLLIF